jgi:predicted  nucleic acid-binding Zn-ribbon protein
MSLEMIKRKAGLNIVYWKFKNSLDRIMETNPHRHDLIESMNESMQEVAEAILYFDHCDKVYQKDRKTIFELELQVSKLKAEIKELESRQKTFFNDL